MIAIEADDLYDLWSEQAKEKQGTRTDLIEPENISEKIQQSLSSLETER
jgi:hypothetical protein